MTQEVSVIANPKFRFTKVPSVFLASMSIFLTTGCDAQVPTDNDIGVLADQAVAAMEAVSKDDLSASEHSTLKTEKHEVFCSSRTLVATISTRLENDEHIATDLTVEFNGTNIFNSESMSKPDLNSYLNFSMHSNCTKESIEFFIRGVALDAESVPLPEQLIWKHNLAFAP